MIRELVTRVLSKVASRVARVLQERGEFSVIQRDAQSIYLERYYWTRLLGFGKSFDERPGSFLHLFLSDDPLDEVHTHPWKWMVSIIISPSGYKEIRYRWQSLAFWDTNGGPNDNTLAEVSLHDREVRHFGPLSINIIRAEHAHRIELYGGQPCWTLFIHGPRHGKDWGFVKEKAPHDFRPVKRRTRDLRR